ncbi:class II aldolase/adducin family protein [Feifania hominis]|uniref:Class II aldolase/adducin family protein n=1 Tax=Feifania hominis TaxID=2763660 RepID=A0A926HVD3_9FIRM|nr:class II aldolase/adducin family protein [Feifania hominis]MBC8537213.1 class II aldolase/adducin family protein [Feifania hominis]
MAYKMDPRINMCLLEQCAEGTRRIMKEGFTPSRGGDISLRDPSTGLIYVSGNLKDLPFPYATFLEFRAQDIAVFEPDGTLVSPWAVGTIEMPMHLAIMRARPDVNCVLHTHPQWSTVFAMTHKDIPLVLTEQSYHLGGEIRTAKYAPAGAMEVGDYVVEALGDRNAVLMDAHGSVAVGERMDMAFAHAHYLENVAQKAIFASLLDRLYPLKEDEILADHFMEGTA